MSTRRRWPWIVALVSVVLVAVAAWFAGEYIARGMVERTIREQVVRNLDLRADQQIDVQVAGPILPQLIVGSLGDVTISSDDVTLHAQDSAASLTADISVSAQDVPIRGGDWSGARARLTVDQQQLQDLLRGIDGFPADTVTIDAPQIDVSMELSLFALSVPVGVGLTPGVAAGDLVLTPTTLRLGGAEVSADVLIDQFGAVARTVVRDWKVCVASYLPAAVSLTRVDVRPNALTATFEIDSAILAPGAAQQKGTCA